MILLILIQTMTLDLLQDFKEILGPSRKFQYTGCELDDLF